MDLKFHSIVQLNNQLICIFEEAKMINFNTACITTSLIATLLLTGCGDEKLRTASYYRENPDEMEKILEKCDAEREKGYKPEGNFGENCATARQVKRIQTRNQIRSAIIGQ